jgi:hypothetical protein
MLPYCAIDLDKTRRIFSIDKPWQARIRISKNFGSISLFKDSNNLKSSFFISLLVGNVNSKTVIKSDSSFGISNSVATIIKLFGCVLRILTKLRNFREIEISFKNFIKIF